MMHAAQFAISSPDHPIALQANRLWDLPLQRHAGVTLELAVSCIAHYL